MSTDEYHALWRSSAHEAVPYTDDFPAALLVLPELIDGAIGQGNATKVNITLNLNKENSRLTVTDNGGGIRNERRLFQWAAVKATDNIHRNGHGTKKCLTKWEPDYIKAKWCIKWRNLKKNLQEAKGPFFGKDTNVKENEENVTILMPSGCEISIEFSAEAILHGLATKSTELFKAIKEIIQTRYSEETLLKTEFVIEITNSEEGVNSSTKSSRKDKWHSFKKCVEDSVASGTVAKLDESRHTFPGGCYTVEVFYITPKGTNTFSLKNEFPKFGLKSMKSSRVHISLDGRMIEAMPIYQLMNREANHNDYNGYIIFVDFIPNTKEDFDKLPVPCTTKVSLYDNNPVFKDFKANFTTVFGPIQRRNFNEPAVPRSAPVVAPVPVAPRPAPVVAPVPVTPRPVPVPVPAPVPVASVVAPVPVAPVPVASVIAVAPTRAPTPLPAPASLRPTPVTPIIPTPPPAPTHNITYGNVDTYFIINENGIELCRTLYVGAPHISRDYCDTVLSKVGIERFKEWLPGFIANNMLLRM